MTLKQKVAVITGGSKGLGKAIALRLAQEGANIAILDVDYDSSMSVVNEIENIGRKAIAVKTDVGVVSDIKKSVDMIISELGRVDILVNNAGVAPTTSIDKITEEEWKKVIDINLNSVFFMSQAVLEPMTGKNWGRIINIASMAGRQGSIVAGCHYGASKAGILGITKNFARFLAKENITVNAIAPGPIMSDIIRSYTEEKRKMLRDNCPLGRIGTPENIAETVAFLCSDGADYITGATIDVNGGLFMG